LKEIDASILAKKDSFVAAVEGFGCCDRDRVSLGTLTSLESLEVCMAMYGGLLKSYVYMFKIQLRSMKMFFCSEAMHLPYYSVLNPSRNQRQQWETLKNIGY
jgi:hypothetical protein